MPNRSKCRVFRVTKLIPCAIAVAANSPSMVPSALPLRSLRPIIAPHASATVRSTAIIRPSNLSLRILRNPARQRLAPAAFAERFHAVPQLRKCHHAQIQFVLVRFLQPANHVFVRPRFH